MKYSLKQLTKYVPQISEVDTKELINRIWQSIAEVEHVEYLNEKYNGVVVAKAERVEKHPKSDHLMIVTVDIGEKVPKTVVTGAQNVSVGDYVPYIPVGGTVPALLDESGNPIIMQVRSMAGVPSEGMLASEREMGVSDDHTGIMILKEDELRVSLVPGMSVAIALEYDDVIIEIENKTLTHRGDCFSAAGLGREIATLFGFDFIEPDWQTPSFTATQLFGDAFDKDLPAQLKISIEAPHAVDRYTAIVLDGIVVKKSPQWLQLFLAKHGVNSVSNVVDITNYVMLDYGQPMHAFDSAMIAHKKRDGKLTYGITVRNAKPGEKIVTLDSKERILSEGVTVIADATTPVGLAGVIGGQKSGISDTTTRLILESAVFDKYSIRRTSMEQGLVTDASVVFSRKQDPEKTGRALLRAVHLLQELAGAIIASPVADEIVNKPEKKTVVISQQKLETFIGIAVSASRIDSILTGLGFTVQRKGGDLFSITVPSWRPDVSIDEDIYEEVARMIGYDRISPELPQRGIFGVSLSRKEQVKQAVMQKLVGLGLLQTLNFSFTSKQLYDQCRIPMTNARAVVNAISPDVQYMRKHVTPAIIAQLSKNQYVTDRFALFEIGKTSRLDQSYVSLSDDVQEVPVFGIDELGLPIEEEHISIGVVESLEQPAFFIAKRIVTELFNALGINASVVHKDSLSKKSKLPVWIAEMSQFYKAGRSAIIMLQDGSIAGVIGEPSSFVAREFGFTKQVALVEMTFSAIQKHALLHPIYREPSRYPVITEDYCFEVSEEMTYEEIMSVYTDIIHNAEKKNVFVTISPRDIYAKGNGKKQVTHRVTYASFESPTTDSQVVGIKQELIAAMKEKGGKLV